MLLGIAQRDGLIQPLHHLARDLALTLSQGVIATMAVQRQPKEQCAKGDAKNARNRAYGFTSRNRINSVFPLLIAQISFQSLPSQPELKQFMKLSLELTRHYDYVI
jgi:hypothetical protein